MLETRALSTTRFYLVRHGETEWNAEGREMGQLDSPLTPKGIEELQAVAERFRSVPIDFIYSSDLKRAVLSAGILGGGRGLEIRVDARLRERHLGIFQGLTREEMRARYPREREEYERREMDRAIPGGGESIRQKMERSAACLTELASKHAGKSVLCVTHAGILSAFFQYVFAVPPQALERLKRLNAAVNVFEYGEGGWVMETWGERTFTGPGAKAR